jgi:hypothetical protein
LFGRSVAAEPMRAEPSRNKSRVNVQGFVG